ncbi:chemotaxis protein CheY [Clostridiales bacterium PH28_bin88]|nr:chemotaxis protein CheY [Clostridiales bacterium PH28_bin88]
MSPEGQPAAKGFSVLIVDDQAGVRLLLHEALKEEDLKVYLAAGGEEAIKEVQEKSPDIILMDMKMPGMNGLEVLKEIKKLNYSGPVILMTAYGELEMVNQARKLGVTHHLTKPFDIYEVKALLRETANQMAVNKERARF